MGLETWSWVQGPIAQRSACSDTDPAEVLVSLWGEASPPRLPHPSTREKPMHALTKQTLKMVALLGALSCAGLAQAGPVSGQGTWETTLLGRDLDGNAANGFEAFYDTVFKVTWLRAGSSKGMVWATAKSWAEQDRFGLSGWRLPTTVDKGNDGCSYSNTGGTDCGYNPDSSVTTGSEMAHLFFQVLGNKSIRVPGGYAQQEGYGVTNSGDFEHLDSRGYWSGTDNVTNPKSSAWGFHMLLGFQDIASKNTARYVLAVRDGDVFAAVPEPQSLALTLLALTGALWASRRRTF